jgi:hypothetical protein
MEQVMYKNSRQNEYGCTTNLQHVATHYKHQVFNYNNKNSHCTNNFSLKKVKQQLTYKNSAATFV